MTDPPATAGGTDCIQAGPRTLGKPVVIGFAQVRSLLDRVSTTRGSGWVADEKCDIAIAFESQWLTHPLPRAVLTVSKLDQGLLGKAGRDRLCTKSDPCWIGSVPPAVAGGLLIEVRYCYCF